MVGVCDWPHRLSALGSPASRASWRHRMQFGPSLLAPVYYMVHIAITRYRNWGETSIDQNTKSPISTQPRLVMRQTYAKVQVALYTHLPRCLATPIRLQTCNPFTHAFATQLIPLQTYFDYRLQNLVTRQASFHDARTTA